MDGSIAAGCYQGSDWVLPEVLPLGLDCVSRCRQVAANYRESLERIALKEARFAFTRWES